MRVAVVTATAGRNYGDLRPEAALVKGPLLYADEVRLVAGKLPMLYIQTGEQMRGFGRFREVLNESDDLARDVMDGAIEEIRRRRPELADQLTPLLERAGTPAAFLEVLESVWEETLLPRIRASPPEQHVRMHSVPPVRRALERSSAAASRSAR